MVGEMVECVHCGAFASVASRFCPACGERFGVHSPDSGSGGVEIGSAEPQTESTLSQDAVPLDAGEALPSIPDPIPIRRIILLCGNLALLVTWLGLLLSYYLAPRVRAENESVAPTATVTVVATDLPASAMPIISTSMPTSTIPTTSTRKAAPTPTGSSAGVPATATPTQTSSVTATSVATATPIPPPPTPQIPTPIPTPTP